MIALAILAAASAWLVTRKAPQHRPLAWALTVCAGLDAVRLLELPGRADMALCLGAPAVSTWAYVRVTGAGWARLRAALTYICGLSGLIIGWDYGPIGAYVCTFFCALGGWIDSNEANRWPGWTISQRVALILLAGDALAVASLCAREWISNQAGVVLGLVAVYQMAWWWRWRCPSE